MGLPEFQKGFSFTNLVDFDVFTDTVAMHMATAIACTEFDERLPEIIAAMSEDDLWWLRLTMVTTLTYAGTDHTREYIPFLAYSPSFKGNGVIPVGHFSDISATVQRTLVLRKPWSVKAS